MIGHLLKLSLIKVVVAEAGSVEEEAEIITETVAVDSVDTSKT